VEADDGRGGADPLTLLQLHIGSCTKVTEQQSDGTEVCCCNGRSLAGGEAGYHISLYQWMTLHGVQAASALCRPWLFALRFRLSYGYFHIRISDPKFDIQISGHRL